MTGGFANFGGGIENQGGTLTITNCTIADNSGGIGGGIENQGGTLTVTNSTFDSNSASDGGGIDNELGGTLTITNSTFDSNSAGAGGGILNSSMATATNSTFDSNTASDGGGIFNESGGTLTITNSTFADNSIISGGGGGILNEGMATVTNSTFDSNSVFFGNGGGIANGPAGGTLTVTNSTFDSNSAFVGGGIENDDPATVTNSTFADNFADFFGGGIDNSAPLTITNTTIASNSDGIAGTGTPILNNTIVALNTYEDIAGTVSSSSADNLIGTGGSGGLTSGTNGNQVGVANPGLGPLADNGGPTQTIALLAGSPAINAGSNALAVDPATNQPLLYDQRGPGFPRIVGGTVNIGAYEYSPAVSVAVAVDWGTQSAALQTAADGLRLLPAGRQTDLPWLGINALQITLSQPEALTAGDITIASAIGVNYGPVTVSGSGTSYTIALAQPIDAPDRVTITIVGPDISFNGRIDVLPGDVNDDGVVNKQDVVLVRDQWLGIDGTKPTIFGDINGDGVVNVADYIDVRKEVGTSLPPVAADSLVPGGDQVAAGGGRAITLLVVPTNPGTARTSQRPATQTPRLPARIPLSLWGRGWSMGESTKLKLLDPREQ